MSEKTIRVRLNALIFERIKREEDGGWVNFPSPVPGHTGQAYDKNFLVDMMVIDATEEQILGYGYDPFIKSPSHLRDYRIHIPHCDIISDFSIKIDETLFKWE